MLACPMGCMLGCRNGCIPAAGWAPEATLAEVGKGPGWAAEPKMRFCWVALAAAGVGSGARWALGVTAGVAWWGGWAVGAMIAGVGNINGAN